MATRFGIGSPEQARQAADAGADGVIVGTRLVRAAGEAEEPAGAVGARSRNSPAPWHPEVGSCATPGSRSRPPLRALR